MTKPIVSRFRIAGLLAIALGAPLAGTACNSEDAQVLEARGAVSLPLIAVANGVTYRLSAAQVLLRDANGVVVTTLLSDSSPSATSLSATLTTGTYTAELQGGWQLQRLEAGGVWSNVDAQLVSPAVQPVAVVDQQNSPVSYLFSAGSAAIEFGQGQVTVTIGVGEVVNIPSLSSIPAGNPTGACQVPAEAQPVATSQPSRVVGNGTAASCTGQAFVSAVAQGGIITFNCGALPVVIDLDETAKVFNDKGPEIVIDGGNLVTLNGRGLHRILYQDTCDPAQVWTTTNCQNQDHPRLTVQNLTFANGNAEGEVEGGGAIFARGGRLKIVNSRFFNNKAAATGTDVGGGAVRVLAQYADQPVFVVGSTFGGRGDVGNVASNGGALSGLGVAFSIINSVISNNRAVGTGGNPAATGTPGGGSGGGIYADVQAQPTSLCGVRLANNIANVGGGGLFYVANASQGALTISDSQIVANQSLGFETAGYPGVFVLNAATTVTNSTLSP